MINTQTVNVTSNLTLNSIIKEIINVHRIFHIPEFLLQCFYPSLSNHYSLSARILHRAPPPPQLQVDQNFLTQKIVADPKMRCHQKSFGIWRVTEAILGQKTCFFSKNIFWKKFIINHTIFLNFRYAFFRY